MPAGTVLGDAVGLALSTGRRIVDPVAVERAAAGAGLDHGGWFAAVLTLWEAGFVELAVPEPAQVALLAVTNRGILHHVQATRPD
ncbi:MAG: hypothetical protein ABR540_19355, partial [Acidimicrobiales bacterium]